MDQEKNAARVDSEERPTPETDIFEDHYHIDNMPVTELIDHYGERCRKLEREREELRRDRDYWVAEWRKVEDHRKGGEG